MNRLGLRAIRLVGFHNFDDELIEVNGDLFIIGINESGKTTILDALHLILSGGQGLDFNAAAKMAGRRDEGRLLQGIILRADLSGNPHPDRKGGSITYAAAEFEQRAGKGPVTLVFGASAVDMNARPRRWGVITNRHAAELPLVKPREDGTSRIVHRDELANLLDDQILSDMGKYRTAVADRLFDSREDFDLVTDLWRKAKSYRELSKAARSFDEVFRQVLPAPDTDPFDKVAKGFRDVAEIEQKLTDLGEDVKALHQLCEIRDQVRDARETLFRYHYVEAKSYADELAAKLQRTREEIHKGTERLDELIQQISRLENEAQTLDEQIAILQASSSYQTAAQLDEVETRLKGVEDKIEALTTRWEQASNRLGTLKEQQDKCRLAAATELSKARSRFDELGEVILEMSVQIVDQLLTCQQLLPPSIEEDLAPEPIRRTIADTKASAARIVAETTKRLRGLARHTEQLESERAERTQELRRLEHFEDIVPELDGLDRSLDRLRECGISPRLLYQELEFQPDASTDLRAAVEAALGRERLATIVVPPEEVEKAREIVLDVGIGIRVLDAKAIHRPGAVQPREGTSLLSLVRVDNERVRSHLQASVGTLALLRQPAPDGADQHWFVLDGTGGERGARWRLQLCEPRWIGAETRRRIREQEIGRLQSAIERLDSEIGTIEEDLKCCENVCDTLSKLPSQLDELDLPGSLELLWVRWDQLHEAINDSERQVSEFNDDLTSERFARDQLAQTAADLNKQLDDVDVEAIRTRLEQLSTKSKETTTTIGSCQNQQQETRRKVHELKNQIATIETELSEAHALVADARDELVTALPAGIDDLDHYVFTAKRASQIKDLSARIQDAVAKEASATERLRGSDGVLSDRFATRYRFRMDDRSGWIDVRDHRDQSLDEILHERDETERVWRESLKKKNVELVEQILAHSLTEQLRADIRTLQRTTDGLNRVLENLTFGHSQFQLKTKVTPEHAPFVRLIQRQSLLDADQRKELRDHLENRRDQLSDEGEVPPFLDYRNWYTYRFQLQHAESESITSLGSDELVRGSGGAQATHHYLLLFALARFSFDRSGARVRLLMMDEAFYGVDMQRKELLLRAAKQLDLDLIVASPDLDGTILEDAADSTTVMVEKDEQGNVMLVPLMWKKREAQGELFPEPRPEAIIGHETDE